MSSNVKWFALDVDHRGCIFSPELPDPWGWELPAGEASLRRLFAEEQALSRNVLRENERLKHELSALAIGSSLPGLPDLRISVV